MDLSKKQTTKLAVGCARNERAAQESLYKTFYAQMLRICNRYLKTKDQAEDALNDGFLKVFQNIKSFDVSKGELGAWICTIMIRTAIDHNRKELKFSTEEYHDEQQTSEFFIHPDIISKLYAQDILKNIQQLPDATRIIFNLSVIDGYSHKEISDQLQITESTSRWHLSEAKKKLRALLLVTEGNNEPTDYKAR